MNRQRFSDLIKIAALVFWVLAIVGTYLYLDWQDISLRVFLQDARRDLLVAGPRGWAIFLTAYVVSAVIPFPLTAMSVLAGSLYGSFGGILLVLIGLNVSSLVGFWLARWFGKTLFQRHAPSWIRSYEDMLCQEGFLTVLFMRLLLFPFEVVSFVCGLSNMPFRQYMLATALGSLPSAVTLVVMGHAYQRPRAWLLFGGVMVLSVLIALGIRRTAWARRKLYPTNSKDVCSSSATNH